MSKKKRSNLFPVFVILISIAAVIWLYTPGHNSIGWYKDIVSSSSAAAYDEDGLSSHCAVMVDLTEGRVCYEKNPNERVPVASLTKIMTALVAIEELDSLDMEYTFTESIVQRMEESHASVAGFTAGERVPARDMLYGVMLPSGGDAAVGIAELTSGDEASYIRLMNRKAWHIGMKNTHFSDVTGLDDTDNYSTAADMALLFATALENETFTEIVTQGQYLTKATEQHPNGILLTSTLSEPIKEYCLDSKIIGGKTGYTTGAGLCLATFAESEGHRYILITLGAGDGNKYPSYHFEDAAVLYERYEMT